MWKLNHRCSIPWGHRYWKSQLTATCKKVVGIFKIRFAQSSEIVSRDPSKDWTTKREREEWLYLCFPLLGLSTCLWNPLIWPQLWAIRNQRQKHTRGHVRTTEREREKERYSYCFLKLKYSALLFCQLQWSVLWCNESPGSWDCDKYCTVWNSRLWCRLTLCSGWWLLEPLVSNERVRVPAKC